MLKISYTNNILEALEFLAEIYLNLVKISIYVSMTSIEATWLLGMFHLLILEGYLFSVSSMLNTYQLRL